MPWLRFAEAQEKYKNSRDALQAAQNRLADVKAEAAQSAGPLKCALAGNVTRLACVRSRRSSIQTLLSGVCQVSFQSALWGERRLWPESPLTHEAGCHPRANLEPASCNIDAS